MRLLLESLDYVVLTASNGQQALDVYEGNRAAIDLVLTDVTMPGIGGVELFHLLRQWDPDVRLMALTGHAFDSGTQEYLQSGMLEWLEKPPKLPALAQALRRALAAPVRPPGRLRDGQASGAERDR